MFAVLALLAFVLALFEVDLAGLNLVALGLAFVAAHLLFDYRPWSGRTGGRV